MSGVVYLVTNCVNNKQYVGQSWNVYRRIKDHLNGRGMSKLLAAAVSKYGKEKFAWTTLYFSECQDKLDKAEILMIQMYHTLAPWGYNLALGGCGGKLHPSTKEKIGNYHRHKIVSADTRRKLSEQQQGKKQAPDVIKKIRDALVQMSHENQQQVFVFDALDHSSVFPNGVGRRDLIGIHKVSESRLGDSLAQHAVARTFKLNGKRCYARTVNVPLEDNNVTRVGKKVMVTFPNSCSLAPMLFESMTSASKNFGLGRGVLKYYMDRNRPCPKAIMNDTVVTVCAILVDTDAPHVSPPCL